MPDGDDDLQGLWAETFGEPPSITADPPTLVRVLVEMLPTAPPYRPHPSADGEGVYPRPSRR